MENKNILIFNFFLLILVIYCIYKINILNENFTSTSTTEQQINTAVKKIYLADVEAIRILSNFAIQLSQGGFTVPGNITINGVTNVISDIHLGGGGENRGRNWILHCPEWSGGDNFMIAPKNKSGSAWEFTNQFIFRDDGTLVVKKLIVNENLAVKGTIYGNITEPENSRIANYPHRPNHTGVWTNNSPVNIKNAKFTV